MNKPSVCFDYITRWSDNWITPHKHLGRSAQRVPPSGPRLECVQSDKSGFHLSPPVNHTDMTGLTAAV